MRSISARSSAVSTMSAARTFSSRCLRDLAPGIGTIKTPARLPWAIGQAIESWASVAFFPRAMASSAERSRRFFSTLALSKRGRRARMSSAAISSTLGNLRAQHPAPEHGVGHHRHPKFLAGVDLALLFRITREQRILHLKRSERMHGTATPERVDRALRERDEPCLALVDELGHAPDAFLDWHVRIDARHAKDVERLDAEIFQALLAGSRR